MNSFSLAVLIVFCEVVVALFLMTFFHARLDRRLQLWRSGGRSADWSTMVKRLQTLRERYALQQHATAAGEAAAADASAVLSHGTHDPEHTTAALTLLDAMSARFCELGECDAVLFSRALDCLERGLVETPPPASEEQAQ